MKKWLAVLMVALLWGTVAWAPGSLSLSVSMAQPAPPVPQGAAQSADFDHLRTGFALTDRHAQARCETCHQNGIFQGTPRDCASCHRAGMRLARGNVVMPARHVPTQQACDSCHNTRTFAGARFSHSGVGPGTCMTCHNSSIAPGKPATHVPTTASCETCHRSTSTWLAVTGGHSAANAVGTGTCDTCHNGVGARGKHPAHIQVPAGAARCDSCHKSQASFTVSVRMDHAVVGTAACANCHNGTSATGKPPTHVATTAACETCHRTTANWTSVTGAHTSATAVGTGTCDTCHNGVAAKGKHAAHITVSSSTSKCDSCHRSQTAFNAAVTMNHAVVATTACASCHNGTTARGKSATHVATTAACDSCHRSTTVWTGATFAHSAANAVGTGTCDTCHNGTSAKGKHAAHITVSSSTSKCDSCHKSQTAFSAAVTMNHSVVATTACATCHNGTTARGKSATHVATTATCDSCHRSTTVWTSVTGAHTAANAVGTGTCDTCHNGASAKGKHAGHVPVTAGLSKCDSCHKSQTAWTTSVTMNHTVVATAECKACHNGQYLGEGTTGALAKPANHIPEAQLLGGALLDCKSCHTSTASWLTQRMNHNNSQGNGAGWCKSCHDSATRYAGPMERKSLRHEAGGSTVVTDCSQSGCHRPLGNKGAAYTKWD